MSCIDAVSIINKYINSIMNYVYKDNISFNDLMKGCYYKFLHGLYMFLLVFMLLFNNNLYHLTLVLCFVTMNAFAVVVYHRCPLSDYEEKFSKESTYLTRIKILKSTIIYGCEHEYESTIEMLLNCWSLLSIKCLMILIFKSCKVQVINFNNIYSS
jgi:hypothetical protein